MQHQGIVLIELSCIIYQLAGVEEYVRSLKEGDLLAVSRFVESGRIHIDAAVSEVSSLIVSEFLRIKANSYH
jgi:hypothetical protein